MKILKIAIITSIECYSDAGFFVVKTEPMTETLKGMKPVNLECDRV